MGKNGCCTPDQSCDTSKKDTACAASSCCSLKVKGAIVGGIVLFLYFSASWMLLPFHASVMNSFKSDAAVMKVLADNTSGSGLYIAPKMEQPKMGGMMKDADDKPAKAEAKKKPAAETAAAGTKEIASSFVFMSYDATPVTEKTMKQQMLRFFILCLALAGVLTCIIRKSCGCPVKASFKVALIPALMGAGSNFIWFHFPVKAVMFCAIDCVIGLTLAGIFISKFVLGCKAGVCNCPCCKK